MNRQIVYTGQLPLSGQELKGSKSIMKAIGQLVNDALLSVASPALLSGLSLVPTSPASMSLTLNPGTVYQPGQIDYVTTAGVGALTAYGSLAADATAIILQGIAAAAQNITGFTAPGMPAQSTNFLVEFQVQTQDGTLIGLNYYNSANPQVPLIGPAGAGTQQATERSTVLAVQVLAGSPATTGAQVTPSITAGWLPGYVVTVAFGQTTILVGNIVVATGAPFLTSLTSQHHLGLVGTAPQIDLTSEVKNLLPIANMSALGVTNLTDLACSSGAGLTLNYNAGQSIVNGVPSAITAGTLTLTASATNYVYVNSSSAVVFNATGWPSSGAFYPLAIVITGVSSITSVAGKRGLAVIVTTNATVTSARNCVLQGAVDGNGNENYVTGTGSALTAGFLATSIPIDLTFAAGYGSLGQVDYFAQLTVDNAATWTGLTANATCYCYVDRNTSTGALTYGFSTILPVYQKNAPTNTSGQHWFDESTFTMKVGNGSTWSILQRIFMGKIITNGTNVTLAESAQIALPTISTSFVFAPFLTMTAYQNAAQAVAAGTATLLQLQVKTLDLNSEFSTSTYKYTAAGAETVTVTGSVRFDNISAGSNGNLNLYKNGVNIQTIGVTVGTGVAATVSGTSTPVVLAPGDYLQVYGYLGGLSANTVAGSVNTNMNVTRTA
jgi:hypothetical protein